MNKNRVIMKKYVVTNKTQNEVLGVFKTKNYASEAIIDFICYHNDSNECYPKNKDFLSIFDFEVKEEDIKEITSYEEAKAFLGLSYELVISVCGAGKKHEKALSSLVELVVIAEAWNKEDGFVPDFSNEEQRKYYPCFEYNKSAEGFVYVSTSWIAMPTTALVGSRLCFATKERAEAFGKQFQDLYNDFLLIK